MPVEARKLTLENFAAARTVRARTIGIGASGILQLPSETLKVRLKRQTPERIEMLRRPSCRGHAGSLGHSGNGVGFQEITRLIVARTDSSSGEAVDRKSRRLDLDRALKPSGDQIQLRYALRETFHRRWVLHRPDESPEKKRPNSLNPKYNVCIDRL